MGFKYTPGQYRGLSYEDASRKGLELVQDAARTQSWCHYIDALDELRAVMRHTSQGRVNF